MDFLNIKLDRLILLKTDEKYERGEIVALARSIAKNGLLVPLTVSKIVHTDRYEIISGIKRFYACRLAGLKTAPSYVIDNDPTIARLIIRRGESQDCFDESEAVRFAILNYELTAEELSDITGYKPKEILDLLRISKMTDFEKELIRRNGISVPIASEIASFDDADKRIGLLSEVIQSRLLHQEVKGICERERRGRKRVSVRTPKFKDIRLFDNTVSRAVTLLKEAGVKAEVKSQQNMGCTEYKIRIES